MMTIIRPALRYPGSKLRLMPWLLDFVPIHTIAVDVFGGSASFIISKLPSDMEIYNDRNQDIVNFFRALEIYGVEMSEATFDNEFDTIFGGFIATPDDTTLMLGSGRAPWFEVLGVKADASKVDIRNAFRALSKVHHPDYGGNADDFRRLREAYDAGLKVAKK